DREDGPRWKRWLQTHRVELNAMTTPQFIEWLDGKMADYDKLIPPHDVLEAEMAALVENKIRAAVIERILREHDAEGQIAAEIAKIETPGGAALADGIERLFEDRPDVQWRDHIEAVAAECASDAGGLTETQDS